MAWLERWRRRRECSDTVPATVPESATLEREPPVSEARPFVGRDELLRDVCSLESAVTVLYGDPGVGKSRLLFEAAGQLRRADGVLTSGPVPLEYQPGSLQVALLEALGLAVAEYAISESSVERVGRIFARATESMSEERLRDMIAGAKGLILGVVRAKYGDEAANALESAGRHLGAAREAVLASRIRAASDPGALGAFCALTAELANLTGLRLVVPIDGAERLSDGDFRLLLDLVNRLPDQVFVVLTHSVRGLLDLQRARQLAVVGTPAGGARAVTAGFEVRPLSVSEVQTWVKTRGLPQGVRGLSADPEELHRVTGGLPVYVELALGRLERGQSLAGLEPDGAFGVLVADNYAALTEDEQRSVTLLAAFSDPPITEDVQDLLGVDDVGWAVLERRLVEARILVTPVRGRPWMHELGRRALWERVFSQPQRQVSAERAVATIAASIEREGRGSYGHCIDLANLAVEVPAVAQAHALLAEVLKATPDELAVLGALLELAEEPNHGAVELLKVAALRGSASGWATRPRRHAPSSTAGCS